MNGTWVLPMFPVNIRHTLPDRRKLCWRHDPLCLRFRPSSSLRNRPPTARKLNGAWSPWLDQVSAEPRGQCTDIEKIGLECEKNTDLHGHTDHGLFFSRAESGLLNDVAVAAMVALHMAHDRCSGQTLRCVK